MPKTKFLKLWALWTIGFAAFLVTHLLWLRQVGGFHYDEAWAANFAHRIASEPGFWPLQAMSPYTSAWGHYLTAIFFRLFGTGLFIYRASGIFLVGAGVICLSLALVESDLKEAAALLPLVIAFFPALLANHRFAIEINTFHAFCFGLLALGLSLKTRRHGTWGTWIADAAILAAAFFGATSHVLFVAPLLAAVAAVYWDSIEFQRPLTPRTRALIGLTLAALFGFFLRIHFLIPEKDKSLALLLIAAASAIPVFFPRIVLLVRLPAPSASKRVALTAIGGVLLAFPLFLLIFFSEGSWSLSFFTGGLSSRWPIGCTLIAPAIALFWTFRSEDPKSIPRTSLLWGALTLVATCALAVKPAPRYFEIPLLFSALLFCVLLSRCSRRVLLTSLSLWIAAGTLQLGCNYFKPVLEAHIRERTFHFLFFRDGSSDTLPKQALAQELGAKGCTFADTRSDDPRLLEPLKFLSLGDWPLAPGAQCPGVAHVSRGQTGTPDDSQLFSISF